MIVEADKNVGEAGAGPTHVNAAAAELPPGVAHEVIAGAREWYYYPRGDRFYTTNSTGNWVWVNEATCRKMLIQDGLSDALTKEEREEGVRLTEVDLRVIDLKTERIVRYAGSIAGWRKGFRMMNGEPVLVTGELNVIKPLRAADDARARPDGSCKGWPILGGQLARWLSSRGWGHLKNELLYVEPGTKPPVGWRPEDEGYDQRPYMFAHLARWYDSLLSGRPSRGQAQVYAGTTGCGKTFWVSILKTIFGGQVAHPYAYLMGDSQFNADLASSTVLVVDDEVSKTDMKSRKDLGARLKKFVAVPEMRIEGKGVDALIINPCNRVLFCVNETTDNLSVLPPPSEDLVDPDGRSGKIQIFKFYAHGWEAGFGTQVEQTKFFSDICAELPHFLWWLLNEFELAPELVDDRFGVRPWMHPFILEELEELSAWQRTVGFVDRVLFKEGARDRWVVTAESLHDLLTNEDSTLPAFEKQALKQNYLHLDEIAQKRPDRCVNLRSLARGTLRCYALFREGARTHDEAEAEWMRKEVAELVARKKSARAGVAASAQAGGADDDI